MPTLKDIADYVGVSISTVSRVINNDISRHIKEETKSKVWQAVRELNYVPNESARKLVKGEQDDKQPTKRIGCVVENSINSSVHPYFSPILASFNEKLIESGYSLAFIHTSEELRDEALLYKCLHDYQTDGFFVMGNIHPAILKAIKDNNFKIIGTSSDGSDIPMVDYDRVPAAKLAVDHLIDQGHRRIAFVGGPGHDGELNSEERYKGYKFALYEAGIEMNKDWIIDTRWIIDRSYEAIAVLLKKPADERPTAIFTASDQLGIPAMRAVIESGLRIPEDVAVVSMDNIELSQYTSPPLSSVHVPKLEIGEVAAKMLLDFVRAGTSLPAKVLLTYELMVRESSLYQRE